MTDSRIEAARDRVRGSGAKCDLGALLRFTTLEARKLDRALYVPDGASLHEPWNGVTRVSAPGALVARCLATEPEEHVDWQRAHDEWDVGTYDALRAVAAVKLGAVWFAWLCLGAEPKGLPQGYPIPVTRGPGWVPECVVRARADYVGWKEFDEHLDALDEIADLIDEVRA